MIGRFVLSAAVSLLVAESAHSATFMIYVNGVQNTKGNILVSVFNDAEAFPKDENRAVYKIKSVPMQNETIVTIYNVPPGEYAVAVMHDENANGKMDKSGIGFPKEPFGFSKDAMGTFGPPSFKKAKIVVEPQGTSIRINLKTM